MRKQTLMLGLVTICGWAAAVVGEERIASIPADDFQRLYKSIKPQPGESPWREIRWVTNITEARRRAIEEDKPIVVFTAADGSPLSRT